MSIPINRSARSIELERIELTWRGIFGKVYREEMKEYHSKIVAAQDDAKAAYMISVEFIAEMLKGTDYVDKEGRLCERKKVRGQDAHVYSPITKWTDNKFASLLDRAMKKL